MRYAQGPIELTAEGDTSLRCRVEDGSHLVPHLHLARPDNELGRGLELVHLLADDQDDGICCCCGAWSA
ncbi:hypothetical protein AB0D12_40265 [Streptomyces sp. NPDC048479]|uniref:hypothetical protein n=1 Tax=Streptomyces sp. NPDC048479 TaxID=3154725 RepID=UPI00342421BF